MKKQLGTTWTTYVELDGQELGQVEVNYDASEAEPDVNFAGGLEIESVIYQGENILGRLTVSARGDLEERTGTYINTYLYEDPRY